MRSKQMRLCRGKCLCFLHKSTNYLHFTYSSSFFTRYSSYLSPFWSSICSQLVCQLVFPMATTREPRWCQNWSQTCIAWKGSRRCLSHMIDWALITIWHFKGRISGKHCNCFRGKFQMRSLKLLQRKCQCSNVFYNPRQRARIAAHHCVDF